MGPSKEKVRDESWKEKKKFEKKKKSSPPGSWD